MCHVLIIEDEWIIATHMAQLIEDTGALSIRMAATEEEAVTMALEQAPMVIISDVALGTGSGLAAVKRIIAELGDLPVMFVTGEPRSFQPHLPSTPVLHKPVDDQVLVATFKSISPAS